MKGIYFAIEDFMFEELNNLLTHKGQRSFLLRIKVQELINELKEGKKVEDRAKCGTKDS